MITERKALNHFWHIVLFNSNGRCAAAFVVCALANLRLYNADMYMWNYPVSWSNTKVILSLQRIKHVCLVNIMLFVYMCLHLNIHCVTLQHRRYSFVRLWHFALLAFSLTKFPWVKRCVSFLKICSQVKAKKVAEWDLMSRKTQTLQKSGHSYFSLPIHFEERASHV